MSNFIQGVAGRLKAAPVVVAGSKPEETTLKVVSGAPGNVNEITGPIAAGTPITLPDSVTYEDTDLQVFFNGQQVDVVSEYNYEGAGPTRTQISFTFDLEVGDDMSFRVDK